LNDIIKTSLKYLTNTLSNIFLSVCSHKGIINMAPMKHTFILGFN